MARDRIRRVRLMVVVLAGLAVVLGGCSSTAPSRFYDLSPMATSSSGDVTANRALLVGITQVGVPDYLERPQIATRIGPNEIRYDEFNRWAGHLKENLSRVLVENLTQLLGSESVIIGTWAGRVPVDYQVWVEVIRFDAGSGGDVTLTAKWALYRPEEKELLVTKTFSLLEPAHTRGYDAMVSAGSRAVDALTRDIAEAIRAGP